MMTLDKVYKASHVLKEVIRETDLIKAPNINKDCEVYLKTENLQVTGSFKVRGAYFKISQLSDEEKAKGVIACSAGNHAQGVALAASRACSARMRFSSRSSSIRFYLVQQLFQLCQLLLLFINADAVQNGVAAICDSRCPLRVDLVIQQHICDLGQRAAYLCGS